VCVHRDWMVVARRFARHKHRFVHVRLQPEFKASRGDQPGTVALVKFRLETTNDVWYALRRFAD
jgi:uncharacterized ferritin-like protein (DUF455 family)